MPDATVDRDPVADLATGQLAATVYRLDSAQLQLAVYVHGRPGRRRQGRDDGRTPSVLGADRGDVFANVAHTTQERKDSPMKVILSALAALLLAAPVAAADTVPVTQLSGAFSATNPSVASTNDGVHFGPYANGGSAVGSLAYSGANGLTLSQITALGYTEQHNTSDDSPIAAPYLRIFVNGDANDAIFDTTQCATVVPAESTSNHYDVIAGTPTGTMRYDDDGCGPGAVNETWAALVAAHGSDVISGIYITVGGTGGADLSALVTDLTVNGTTYCFTCQPPPAAGPAGPTGGTSTTTTTVPVSASSVTTKATTCKGGGVRKLHAPKRAGQRFLSTRATLRGKPQKVSGRTITVNLTGRPEANYNVRLTSRYRTHKGKVVTVKTTRNLSVVCS